MVINFYSKNVFHTDIEFRLEICIATNYWQLCKKQVI